MIARRVEEKDLSDIAHWAQTGWDTEYENSFFPKTGFIVDGVAALFMYSTDSKVCFLENLISNRESLHEDKDRAISLLINEAFLEAKRKGYEVAYATTNNPKVIARAVVSHGCLAQPNHTLLTKNLLGPSN